MMPYLKLSGPPYEQGLCQGRALGEAIAHNLELYFHRFEVECKLSPTEARERGRRYLEALRRQSPAYTAGLEGIATGSGQPLVDIATLNVRYEIVYHQFGHEAPNGCTAFALMPAHSADGHLWMGQNWDWMEGVQGALQHITEPDGTRVLAFTEAGIFGGKIGLNSHGLGLCINGLVSKGDHWAGLGQPFHLRTYRALRQRTLEEAQKALLEPPHTSSANFLLGQGAKAVDLEVSPMGLARWEDPRQLVHANHFIAPERCGIEVPPIEWLDRSHHRAERLEQRLRAVEKPGLKDLQAALADREGAPYAVCRTPSPEEYALGEPYRTIVSVIMNLGTGELWISDGPPHENPYVRYVV
ncbi:Acyl-coenzyme A:6-aminopenicillanic acid acyl-transferase [Meiothermus luteus]|uniref:Acyl-coenzyme A:6-aminopenicillanic acid acyl-transferase n=1 Tax=Meiothermus luteus TaxID=2026184 RepID=A0A399EU17_9DEIN|nr:C45 family peptidase [Meiothermus luteus]RIH87020.1 Acyl-coenzyme A:6-aminopenicillanic acid acyl-transferase [Meiothermus luteus]RMH54977.1 MAG: peptidase C45 [Deinococcota bacterium]